MTHHIVTERPEYFTDTVGYTGSFASIDEVMSFLEDRKSVEIDLETSGSSFMTSHIYSMQLGDESAQFVIDAETVDLVQFKEPLESLLLIGQNLAFDIPFLYNIGIVPQDVWDTYLCEYILTMGKLLPPSSRSLGALVKKYVGVEVDKSEQESIADTGISTPAAIEYAANDVKYLTLVSKAQYQELSKRGMLNVAKVENAFVRVLAYIEYSGVKVDKDKWMGNVRKNEYLEYKYWQELTEQYCQIVGTDEAPVFPSRPINWNSSKQVIEFMKYIDVPVVNAKTGKETVDAAHLAKYKDKHPIVELYLKYKEVNKEVTTYGREWLNNVLSDGKVHTKYKSMVDTGRTACGDTKFGPFPNMQNLPSSKEIRSCFIPSTKRNTFVVCDYSSQESVILADMSQEKNLLEFYLSGEADLHSFTASKVFSDKIGDTPIDKIKELFPEERQASKSANFAITYGGSGATIANNLNISIAKGNEVYDNYMKAFPGLNKFFDEQRRSVFSRGFILINNVTGRRRYGNDIRGVYQKFQNINWDRYRSDEEYKEECKPIMKQEGGIEREALNTPIQGTAADMSKIAGIMFLKWIEEKKFFGKVLIPVFLHDEYVVETSKGRAEKVAEKLKECMEEAAGLFLTTLSMKAEPVITEEWEH